MQEKNDVADTREGSAKTRFFLAMAKTGPYIELAP
jgi:hypothetical protein